MKSYQQWLDSAVKKDNPQIAPDQTLLKGTYENTISVTVPQRRKNWSPQSPTAGM
jgi:hypothetical protein